MTRKWQSATRLDKLCGMMPHPIEAPLVEAYSRGEIDRQAIAAQLGRPVSVADLLLALRAAHLPLPRYPSSLNADDQAWLARWLSQSPRLSDAD